MNLPDKITELPLPQSIENQVIRLAVNGILDYLAERDRLPWDVSLLGRQTVTRYEQGAGGCCEKCEIYLDYKDDYQCSDDQCECHRVKTEHAPIDDWENEIRRRFYVYDLIKKSPSGAEKDLIAMIQRIKDENSSIHYAAGYRKGFEDGGFGYRKKI